MAENGTAGLEPNEKQKKILAAKKKLKSFQAKRAAATVPATDGDQVNGNAAGTEQMDGASSPRANGEAYAGADDTVLASGQSNDSGGMASQTRDDEADDLAKELEQLKLQINAERKQLEDENKRTRAELQTSQEKLSLLESSSAAKEKSLRELVDEHEHEIQRLVDDAKRIQKEAAEAVEDAYRLSKTQLAEREAHLTEEHNAEAARLNALIEERDSRIEELVRSAEEARTAHDTAVMRLTDNARVAADEAAIKAKQDQQHIADLESKLTTQTERAEAGETQCAALEDTKRELEAAMQILEVDVAAKKTELENAHTDMAEKQATHEEELLNMSMHAEAVRKEHQAQVTLLNENIASVGSEKSECETRIAKLEEEVALQDEVSKEKSQRIDGLEADVAHVSKIRDNIQQKHDKLVLAQKESRETIDKLLREKTEVSEALVSMEQIKNEIAAQAEADKEEHATEKSVLEAAASGLKARVHELEMQVEGTGRELENERSICAQVRDEKKQAESEHAAKAAELGQQLEDEKTARQRLGNVYGQAQSTIAALEEKNAKLEEDLQIEAEAAREAFEELSQEHHDLGQKHSRLSAAHGRLSEKHLKAIASTQAWITELQEASVRHKDELCSLGEKSEQEPE
ncbi:hypothetical protein H4217_005738 [Coemansia sp. RSA 1939]|nr:hypothetical protein H4217_005738 [Coemansia sp. RSA 1939]KAJ2598373.1 hypothetical protein EV177_007543 [Coemansia sp. RSA 1804]